MGAAALDMPVCPIPATARCLVKAARLRACKPMRGLGSVPGAYRQQCDTNGTSRAVNPALFPIHTLLAWHRGEACACLAQCMDATLPERQPVRNTLPAIVVNGRRQLI